MVAIQVKRVYEAARRGDGVRLLVERLWPRGIKKEELKMDLWLKEIAPSAELRKWFAHDPAKWGRFQTKYFAELDKKKDLIEPLLPLLHRKTVTLLYSSRDTEHNSAVCLKKYLEKKLRH